SRADSGTVAATGRPARAAWSRRARRRRCFRARTRPSDRARGIRCPGRPRGAARGSLVARLAGDAEDELAGVGAVEQHVDRVRQVCESLDYCLQRLELPLPHPPRELGDRLADAIEMIEHDEALEPHALNEEVGERAWSAGWAGLVVAGYEPAQDDSSAEVEA